MLPLEVMDMRREWLIKKRESLDFTCEQVAVAAGITRQFYSMIEKGQRNPSVTVAKKLAEIVNCSWMIFFEQKGNETLPRHETA